MIVHRVITSSEIQLGVFDARFFYRTCVTYEENLSYCRQVQFCGH